MLYKVLKIIIDKIDIVALLMVLNEAALCGLMIL